MAGDRNSSIARRDAVWNAVLVALNDSPASIKIGDVKINLDRDVSDRTIQRTMTAMRELGWLQKDKETGHYWFPGPKAIRYLAGIDEDTSSKIEEYLEASSRLRRDREETGTELDPAVEEREPEPEPELEEPADAVDPDVRSDVERIHIPGSGSREDERREAVENVLEYLREHGSAQPSELKNEFYEVYPGSYVDANSWWKNLIYPSLSDSSLAESGGEGSRTWTYRG